MNKLLAGACALMVAAGVALAATDPADTYPQLHPAPWPKRLRLGAGHMQLSADSRVVAGEGQLRTLAEVLAAELAVLTGMNLQVTSGPGRAGDIVLKIDPAVRAGE